MSVRHQRRLYIEKLFSNLKQDAGECRIYNLYVPEDGDIKAIAFLQRKNSLRTLKNRYWKK